MVITHEHNGFDVPTYSNTLLHSSNLVGWQGSQVTEHVWALVGPVVGSSLKSKATQVGQTICYKKESIFC